MPFLGSILKTAIALRSKVPNLEITRKPNGIMQQQKVLRKLLKKAQYTSFGEYYDFGDMLKERDLITAFRQKVPVFDYNAIYRKWWYRSLNGEAYVCWPAKIDYFALSSGTSEASSKHIPVTRDMLKAIKKTSIRQLLSLAKYDLPEDLYEKGILMLGGSTHLHFNGTFFEGDLSGITAGNIPFWFQHFYKPGKRISREREWTTKLDEIVRKAPDWDIGFIVGVPAWLQVLMERIITTYKLQNIHQIWPNLSIYVHGGVSFGPYAKGFSKLLAHPLIYIETYLASEGFIAYQSRPGAEGMELVLDNGLFYEFIPFNSSNFSQDGNPVEHPETYTIGQVKEGQEYALLISTCSGAWRYLIGDTIKFTSTALNEIVITGRTKHFLNLCGEHLSQENMNRAIEMLEHQLNITIREFTVAGIQHDSMFAHKWYLGTDDPVDPETARQQIDNNLKLLNDDYRVERIAAIKDVLIAVYPSHVFYDWMKLKKKEGGQHKFPRVLKKEIHAEWETFLSTITNKK
ncbi:MAG TPA: GH3 auxin-responsive promoter family protein [Bacteroidales bacterium]|nr:GH3 auxin-responsive promoter family protein [Bacteroidales bacterium]HSA43096.1 GH3 auxin-responsive promoter family protein [Bacteroidales bacterium]